MEATSGQLLFDFDQKELRRLLAFPKESGKAQERARKESAEGWFQKGLELEQRGAPIEQAIAAYMTAADLDPSSAGALVNLGTIYFNARQWNKAEAFYTRALEVDTNYALAHFNLGNLYDERGKLKLALKHYQAAVGLNPNYADAHYNLALLHQGNGQVMDAVRHWTIYLKLDPGSSWGAIARRELDKLRKSALVPGSDSMRAPTSA
jgi:tetratricopeptide (TPR) repeat protein